VTSRFEAAAAGGLEPLVGRLAEQQLLSEHLRQISEGRGSTIILKGDAGIGKSRLVHLAREQARDQAYLWLETSCSRLSRQSPLHPVVALLRAWFDLRPGDSKPDQAAKLERGLAPLGGEREQAKPLIAALLGLPASGVPAEGSPQLLRSETLRYVVSLLNRAAESRPVVLAVEDLHWVDPSTLEFLGLLIDQSQSSRMLTMLTARPSFEHSWTNREHVIEVALNHLGSDDVRGLVASISGGKPIPEELLRMIVAKTDGVPLFVEELTRMILNAGSLSDAVRELAIPATLKDLLAARLDSLGAAKETAQVGAVLGHSFGYPLIRAVTSLDEGRLSDDLDKLVASQLLLREGVLDKSVFTFKHALLQDAAYEMLLKKSRQGYHGRVASVLVGQFPATSAAQPELVAQHYTHAGDHANAVDYWHRAGHKDLMASANLETIEHVAAGLESLDQLDPGPDRDRQELKLRGLLAPALMATRGFASAELEQTLDRSQSLVGAIGEGAYAFPILWGVWSYYQLRGRYGEAEAMARRNLEIALAGGDVGSRIEAMICIADTQWYLGQNVESAATFEDAERLYDPAVHGDHAYVYGLDPGLFARCHRAMALWRLGYPQRAAQLVEEALRDAEAFAHANTTGMVLMFAAFLAHQYHDAARVEELAGRLLELCRKHGLLQWTALGMVLHGWAGVQLRSENLGELMQGLGIYEMTGARMGLSYHRSLLAEAHVRLGQAGQGLEVIERCIRDARDMRETFYLPQLLQLLGDWSLNEDRSHGLNAENAYRESLALAQSQQARLPALRTATSLARWLDEQGRTSEAVTVLQDACAAYPGATDTRDVGAARAVLAGLSRV
jgi:tetratricopeptide (TPR) repeat protein